MTGGWCAASRYSKCSGRDFSGYFCNGIHTFPLTKYGFIHGEVTSVSDDAIVDEKRGLIYGMQSRMAENTILVDGKEVRLKLGMAVTAEVQTGKRRIIEFFLAPLVRYGQEGLRER